MRYLEARMSAVPLILIAVFISVIGQLLVKKGLNLFINLDFSTNVIGNYFRILSSPYVVFGFLIYFCSAFLWLYALTKVDLSFAYPFLALSYVLIMLFSWLFLGETIPLLRVVGVLVICFGVFLISRS